MDFNTASQIVKKMIDKFVDKVTIATLWNDDGLLRRCTQHGYEMLDNAEQIQLQEQIERLTDVRKGMQDMKKAFEKLLRNPELEKLNNDMERIMSLKSVTVDHPELMKAAKRRIQHQPQFVVEMIVKIFELNRLLHIKHTQCKKLYSVSAVQSNDETLDTEKAKLTCLYQFVDRLELWKFKMTEIYNAIVERPTADSEALLDNVRNSILRSIKEINHELVISDITGTLCDFWLPGMDSQSVSDCLPTRQLTLTNDFAPNDQSAEPDVAVANEPHPSQPGNNDGLFKDCVNDVDNFDLNQYPGPSKDMHMTRREISQKVLSDIALRVYADGFDPRAMENLKNAYNRTWENELNALLDTNDDEHCVDTQSHVPASLYGEPVATQNTVVAIPDEVQNSNLLYNQANAECPSFSTTEPSHLRRAVVEEFIYYGYLNGNDCAAVPTGEVNDGWTDTTMQMYFPSGHQSAQNPWNFAMGGYNYRRPLMSRPMRYGRFNEQRGRNGSRGYTRYNGGGYRRGGGAAERGCFMNNNYAGFEGGPQAGGYRGGFERSRRSYRGHRRGRRY